VADPTDESRLAAGEILGLLAEPDRLRVVAALTLGESTMVGVARASGLDARRAGRALARLVAGGLVEESAGRHRLLVEELQAAARASADHPPDEDHDEAGPAAAPVLRAFVRQGRLVSIPSAKGKRRVILDLLSQDFEPGRRYPEREVNEVLRRRHPDVAALRRYLVDEEFMERDEGVYWRVGGSFDV
jgi:hypothetical protein